METKQIRLRVLTPLRVVLDKEIDFVILRTKDGDMGVKHGHEAYTALLDYEMMTAFINNQLTDVLIVLGGVVTISDNTVVLLSEMAERPGELQKAINKREKDRAANKQKEQLADLDMHRTERALRRSLVHMDVSSYSIIQGHDSKSNQ